MIEALEIVGFQSHKKSQLQFGSGVNVIVGKSDCGKSAVLRALRLVLENKPSGDSFINHDCKSLTVAARFGDAIVSRTKGDGKNEYALGKETFTAFGQGVPEPVNEATRFHDVNFQYQLDAPFILSMTPGEAGQYLNTIMNLDVIDASIRAGQTMLRDSKAAMANTRASIAELEKQIADNSWIADAEALVAKLATLKGKAAEQKKSMLKVAGVLSNIVSTKIADLPDVSADIEALPAVESEYNSTTFTKNQIAYYVEQIESLDIRDAPEIAGPLAALAECERSFDEIEEARSAIACAVDSASEYAHSVDEMADEIAALKTELDAIKTCPTCGRPL